jgi:hypothetical protein
LRHGPKIREPCVDVHVRLLPASFAHCEHGADAVHALFARVMGGPKAYVAIMRKLLILATALIRGQRKWAPAAP